MSGFHASKVFADGFLYALIVEAFRAAARSALPRSAPFLAPDGGLCGIGVALFVHLAGAVGVVAGVAAFL